VEPEDRSQSAAAEPTDTALRCPKIYRVLQSPKGWLLHCTLHQVKQPYEAQVDYGIQPALHTQRVSTIETAATSAEKFKQLAPRLGYFEHDIELPC